MSERNTPMMNADLVMVPLAIGTTAEAGNLAGVGSDGYAYNNIEDIVTVIGRCEETVANDTGVDGGKSVKVRRGKAFKLANSATDPVTQASFGKTCYAEDKVTVAATDATATLPAAGKVMAVDADGIWVLVE